MDELLDSLQGVPIVDFGDYRYFVHPLTDGIPFIEPSLLRDVTNEIVRAVDFDGVDRILAPEAMGIHLGAALALQVDIPLAIARKRRYGLSGEVSVAQVTGYDENELFINGIEADHAVVVVDDVVSTGGTRRAIIEALDAIEASLEAFVTVFDKRDDPTEERDEVEGRSLLTVIVDGDAVSVLDA